MWIYFLLFWNSNSRRLDTRVYVLPLTELHLETPSDVYTNLILTNPLESTAPQSHYSTHSSTAPPTPIATAQPNAFQWDTTKQTVSVNSTQEYTTTSLTSPLKGVIPTLMREESHSIPIPGRTQSHDDIRMIGVASHNNSCFGSPRTNYCFSPISPMSPTGHYTCNSPTNLSPPINYYSGNQLHVGGTMVARRALSRATSPLSHSVPTGVQYSSSPSSSSCRTSAVKNCSRSDPNIRIKQNQKYAINNQNAFSTLILTVSSSYALVMVLS